MTSAEEVIDAMYTALFAGDVDGALRHCADDAQFHAATPVSMRGDHPMGTYLTELFPQTVAEMQDYAVLNLERDEIDDLVVSRVRSTHGSGVMVFRVADGKVTDIWSINSRGREAIGYF